MSDWKTFKKWAEDYTKSYLVAHDLVKDPPSPLLLQHHPAVMIQSVLKETFRPMSPVELYSDHQPALKAPKNAENADDLVPIDILLGCYNPDIREIKIFTRNINHFADTVFKRNPHDVEFIVRLHEYAHAILHLGVFWTEENELIREYPQGKETSWGAFLEGRTQAFKNLPEETSEWATQLLVWIALSAIDQKGDRERLQDVFLTVMGKQPPHYKLSTEVLEKAAHADCTVLLPWLRQPKLELPEEGSDALAAAEALLMVTCRD